VREKKIGREREREGEREGKRRYKLKLKKNPSIKKCTCISSGE
jgi:hypothetical protein